LFGVCLKKEKRKEASLEKEKLARRAKERGSESRRRKKGGIRPIKTRSGRLARRGRENPGGTRKKSERKGKERLPGRGPQSILCPLREKLKKESIRGEKRQSK